MGNLVYFEDHHPGLEKGRHERHRLQSQSLIPVQLALDEYDIEECFSQLARYGRCSVYPRANPGDSGKILFLIRINDAIALNQYLLDCEDSDNQAMIDRIDLIQMLENCEESLLSKAWDKIGLDSPAAKKQGLDSFTHIGQ